MELEPCDFRNIFVRFLALKLHFPTNSFLYQKTSVFNLNQLKWKPMTNLSKDCVVCVQSIYFLHSL